MSYYLREIFRSFVNLVLLEIKDKPIPKIGKSHTVSVLAHGCITLDGIRWRSGDGKQLNGEDLESRHLGECRLITEDEAQKILIEIKKPIEYKILKGFVENG